MPVKLGNVTEHGFDEPLALLSDCHRRIEHFLGVLQRIDRQGGEGALSDEYRRAAEASLKYFREAAPRHMEDEEQSLFPQLRASAHPAAQAALAAMESLHDDHTAATIAHGRVDVLFRQWLDTGTVSAERRTELTQVLAQLEEMYRAHLTVEDMQLFPLAAKALNAKQLNRLGREMADRRHIPFYREIKQKEAPMDITSTIDVRPIPGPQRHPLIFRTFEGLALNYALELINDHDPFPLHNQFNLMKRGQFSWEYLQQGPDLWRVRIGRIAAAPVRQ